MTAIIHPTTTREDATEQGFGGFNAGDHIPIEITEVKNTTITVRVGDDKVTFAFVVGSHDNLGFETFFECVDITIHNREKHKTLVFDGGAPAIRSEGTITAILLGGQHYGEQHES
jgi:hypothetical protein